MIGADRASVRYQATRPDDGDLRERLTVRRRGGRKRAMGTRRPIETPLAANQRWSLDFVSDQMTDGRRFRILTVIDNCTRECLALVADTEARPHSKLGWLTPRDYARAISGESGRRAGNPDLSACRPLATPAEQGSDQPRTLVIAG